MKTLAMPVERVAKDEKALEATFELLDSPEDKEKTVTLKSGETITLKKVSPRT